MRSTFTSCAACTFLAALINAVNVHPGGPGFFFTQFYQKCSASSTYETTMFNDNKLFALCAVFRTKQLTKLFEYA
jgi:hypothetical protein